MEHSPDEQLMQQLESLLRDEPRSIHWLHQATEPKRTRKEIRQALSDLMHFDRVTRCSDGLRYGVKGGRAA